MEADVLKTTVKYVAFAVPATAFAVPATVAVSSACRLLMEWLNQRQKIKAAIIEQAHNITADYLNKALDPNVPLAMRQQLLRFLATPDSNGSRLENWAKGELIRVGNIVEEANRAVESAEKELLEAKTAPQVAAAEQKLREATLRKRSLMDAPVKAPITAAALRAGLIKDKDLSGLDMQNSNLKEMTLGYKTMHGANFSGSDLTDGVLQGCDLRGASFSNANLTHVSFYESDLRSADFQKAEIRKCNFSEAHLEGADLRGAIIKDTKCLATYDNTTQWPDGFDPVEAGAVDTTRRDN